MSTVHEALDPFRLGWSPEVIREHAVLEEHDSFESMVKACCGGQRITSGISIVQLEDGNFRLLAFRPSGALVAVAAANSAEFALASWQAHGCPDDEAQSIEAGKRLAASLSLANPTE